MNLRKDNNGKALAAWKKISPAIIERPLRYIRSKGTSVRSIEARKLARRSDDVALKELARSMPQ